jgi:hypothetical protein
MLGKILGRLAAAAGAGSLLAIIAAIQGADWAELGVLAGLASAISGYVVALLSKLGKRIPEA